MKLRSRPSPGFSLVVSLIIITLLAVLVVSFLTSTSLDRTTARAFFGKSQAETAASTAVNQAISLLTEHVTQFPDSVTFWETLQANGPSGKLPVEGTMLYFHDQPMPEADIAPVPTQRYLLPLMSRGVDANGRLLGAVPVAEKKRAMDDSGVWSESRQFQQTARGLSVSVDDTAVDLNQARFNGDKVGWIGSPPPELDSAGKPVNDPAPRPYRAKWIDLKENGDPKGRTIGRYAFWIEDESFKLNLNALGAAQGGRGSEWTESARLRITPPELAAQPLPQQFAAMMPLQGLLRSARAPANLNGNDAARDTAAANLLTFRDGFLGGKLPDQRSFNQFSPAYRVGDETKFLTTTFSSALNLSRHGSQRLNLNGLGFEKRFDDLSVPEPELQLGIERLTATIRHHAPKFYQRFYRSSFQTTPAILNAETVTNPDHRKIYLYKIAANIRDYMDPDFQPTLIVAPGVIYPRNGSTKLALPESEGPAPSEVWAQGKDSAPFLQEAVARYRSRISGGRWELQVDYYVEFWNMTNRDISAAELGPNPVLRISNQVGWNANGGGGAPLLAETSSPGGNGNPTDGRSMVVDLINNVGPNGLIRDPVIFRAGSFTVITTDPDFNAVNSAENGPASPAFSGGLNKANVYYRNRHLEPTSNRFYAGRMRPSETGIRPVFRDGAEDYQTEVVLANNAGFLEFHASPFAHGGSARTTSAAAGTNNPRDDWYGGTLLGNTLTASQLSDPRTNNEQLVYTRFLSNQSTSEPDQSRYWNTVSAPRFSLGYPNIGSRSAGGEITYYANPHRDWRWPDYYRGWNHSSVFLGENPTARTAPAFIFNGILTDADGALVRNPDGTSRYPAGTVLPLTSIGQLGDVFDPARVRGNRGSLREEGSRGGGRTLRIGQRDDRLDATIANPPSRAWASWRLADFLSVTNQLELPGLININGLLRDCPPRRSDGDLKLDSGNRIIGAGATLRAALYGARIRGVTRSSGDGNTTPLVADRPLDSEELAPGAAYPPGLRHLIDQAARRMTQNDPALGGNVDRYFGPFSERGEISELDVFSIGSNLFQNVKMEDSFDRTREEVARRLLELITTRGNVFTVYAVGQSIREGTPGSAQRMITGTHRMRVTFQLIPKREDNTDFRVTEETFDPKLTGDEPRSVRTRFAKPHHYDIRILQVGA